MSNDGLKIFLQRQNCSDASHCTFTLLWPFLVCNMKIHVKTFGRLRRHWMQNLQRPREIRGGHKSTQSVNASMWQRWPIPAQHTHNFFCATILLSWSWSWFLPANWYWSQSSAVQASWVQDIYFMQGINCHKRINTGYSLLTTFSDRLILHTPHGLLRNNVMCHQPRILQNNLRSGFCHRNSFANMGGVPSHYKKRSDQCCWSSHHSLFISPNAQDPIVQ